MKYFYDTEFIDNGRTIDLVSIGIVAEDGRELYAVSAEFDIRAMRDNQWLMENVWPSLPNTLHDQGTRCAVCPKWGHLDLDHPDVRSRGQIARAVRDFLLVDDNPHLWSWFPSYDHVALAQLYGTMANLPQGIPMRTNDIQQELDRLGILDDQLPHRKTGSAHNALGDAHYHRELYGYAAATARGRGHAIA